MRTDDDGAPLVHRVAAPSNPEIEARLGLDQLLARSRALQSREARERAAKKIEEESDLIRERRMRMAQLSAERFEWKPIASVAIFEVQTCSHCGDKHSVFRGFGLRYERKANPEVKRFAAADCLDKGLPFEMEELVSSMPVCASCIHEQVAAGRSDPSYTFIPGKRASE
jgi:hypothetical protein